MLKKLFILIFISLLFTSCWSDIEDTELSENSIKKTGLRNYPWKDFLIKIPVAWNVITDEKEVIPSPSSWKLELAITSSETQNWFANNLVILSQELDSFTTSVNYSITNNVWAENDYLNYNKNFWKEFYFDDWEKSMIYNFEAKYSAETPIINFLQTAHICENKKAFFITIAIPINEKNTIKYEKMIATFKCK